MLTDVPEIDQKTMAAMFRHGIRGGSNVIILGPSGGGKTLIAQQVAEKEGAELVYINLSVLERTDFQGLPVLSSDRKLVEYATPDYLPFADTRHRDQTRYLSLAVSYLESEGKKEHAKAVNSLLADVNKNEEIDSLRKSLPFLCGTPTLEAVAKEIEKLSPPNMKSKPIVFLFDEVDKAANEVMQTLLEFLQFKSINGRKLNIKSCILTGNLPDEFAHTANLSHAITKRCMTFKLNLDFMQWRKWAMDNNVHEHIIAFLNSNNDYLYKKASDGDPTAYALPSPRTWTEASKNLKVLEQDEQFQILMSGGEKERSYGNEIKRSIIAGNVGTTAAITFNNWLNHYRELDPHVDALLEKGTNPDRNKFDSQQLFICALSACSKVYQSLKPGNEKKAHKYAKNVYKWLGTLEIDVQLGAIRMSFGGDWEKAKEFKLTDIPEFMEVFQNIKDNLSRVEN